MLGHYLLFDRACKQAVALYEKALDAKVLEQMTYGQMPADPAFPIAEGDRDLVLHCRFAVGGEEVMCADSTFGAAPGGNMFVALTTADAAFFERAWAGLAEGGRVLMPLAPSFFARQHGQLRDAFGVNWMFTLMQ